MDRISLTVLGTGNVGRALATGFASAGHRVILGTRDPSRPELTDWARASDVDVASTGEAAAAGEVVIVATAWEGTGDVLALAGSYLDDKVLIDVTNPLRFTSRLELALGFQDSGGEQVQRWAPSARVVKAFNTVGFELMNQPDLPHGPPTLFMAGDDDEAKAVVRSLASDLGWAMHDCGGLIGARLTEPLAMIWIEHAIRSGSRSHSFRMIEAS